MKRRLLLLTSFLILMAMLLPSSAKSKKPLAKWDKSRTFTLPPGYVVEQIAGPPLVKHPMMACFDDRGRLFVAEAAGVNLRAKDLLKNPPNLIRMLEDTNGDGRFDKSTVFADKMTFPMGVLWYRGALYTASPPSVWRLEDTDDDGVADKREELVTKFGFTGNAADVHGPFLHPSGWIYWADGRHGHHIEREDGQKLEGKAARIFRCLPDGTKVEAVCGGGMDNPVEVTFTPEGEAFATVNIFHNRPRIDVIIHCIEGGAFPWHKVQEEFKRTGDLLPGITQLGWVATSGLTRIRGGSLDRKYRGNLFSTLFNRNRIRHHALKRQGASFTADNEDFLISADKDFHPTDVLEDADGSLIVVDTGGWFRIGCPTSQVAKPEILGGIYRIRRADAPRVKDPRGLSIQWKSPPAKLVHLLDDARFVVRDRAIEELSLHGNDAVSASQNALKSKSTRLRRNAIWALTRIRTSESRAVLRGALKDSSDSVRLATIHSLGLQRDAKAFKNLLPNLKHRNLAIRRETATALGRLKNREATPHLLQALNGVSDRFLEHALIYALIEIGDFRGTRSGLRAKDAKTQRGALIAISQMKAKLPATDVLRFIGAEDRALQASALEIIARHPEWATQAVKQLRIALLRKSTNQEALKRALIAFEKSPKVQDLVVGETLTPSARLLLLEAMSESSLKSLPRSWKHALESALKQRDDRIVKQALVVIRRFRLSSFDQQIEVLRKPLRLTALETLAPRMKRVTAETMRFLIDQLTKSKSPMDQLQSAKILSQLPLSNEQLIQLSKVIPQVGPLELPHVVGAFSKSKDPDVGEVLFAKLVRAPSSSSLSSVEVKKIASQFPAKVQQGAEPLLTRLQKRDAKQREKLTALMSTIDGGHAGRGRSLFHGKKASCSACHAVKGQGAQIGPDLSTIGAIRSGPDLLESIVIPSGSFARGYETFVITTERGRVFTGTIGQETGDAIYLITKDRERIRIPRDGIESIVRSKISMMPEGLDEQLSRDEIRDLLAYLQSLK